MTCKLYKYQTEYQDYQATRYFFVTLSYLKIHTLTATADEPNVCNRVEWLSIVIRNCARH